MHRPVLPYYWNNHWVICFFLINFSSYIAIFSRNFSFKQLSSPFTAFISNNFHNFFQYFQSYFSSFLTNFNSTKRESLPLLLRKVISPNRRSITRSWYFKQQLTRWLLTFIQQSPQCKTRHPLLQKQPLEHIFLLKQLFLLFHQFYTFPFQTAKHQLPTTLHKSYHKPTKQNIE